MTSAAVTVGDVAADRAEKRVDPFEQPSIAAPVASFPMSEMSRITENFIVASICRSR